MRRWSLLLGVVPLLGLGELALHAYFARRAPGFEDYAALAPQLLELKRAGMPVVTAPAWAEPLLRQAAPAAFPLAEVARPDDTGFGSFLEVSLLGAESPLAGPVQSEDSFGPFRLRVRKNPGFEPVRFDFVSALVSERARVSSDEGGELQPCPLLNDGQARTGGLHGPVTRPRQRYSCPGERVVAATLIEDQDYRARRCILVDAPRSGSIVLEFQDVPASRKLVGFAGFSYFLGRDAPGQQVELTLSEAGRELGRHRAEAARGWLRFELPRSESTGDVTLQVRRLADEPGDFCFALEAR